MCESYGRLDGEVIKLLRDLVATAVANGLYSLCVVGQWGTLGSRVGATDAAGGPADEVAGELARV